MLNRLLDFSTKRHDYSRQHSFKKLLKNSKNSESVFKKIFLSPFETKIDEDDQGLNLLRPFKKITYTLTLKLDLYIFKLLLSKFHLA